VWALVRGGAGALTRAKASGVHRDRPPLIVPPRGAVSCGAAVASGMEARGAETPLAAPFTTARPSR
jgi:hypothetical protein